MTSEYTPTEADMRERYVRVDRTGKGSRAEYEAEFDRFIAKVKAEALLSDEAVLRALNAEEPRAATDNLADWGEESIARMRAALTAALGEDESNE